MDNLTFYAPIEKTNDELRMVYGYASTEALDSQGEVVKKEALSKAIEDYMKWANIREMHQPSAVGKTKQAVIDKKGLYIAAKVIDEKAWEKVKEGVYNGFSIGGRVKLMKENEITDLTLSEISLVDRPANPECKFDVFKANMNKDIEKASPACRMDGETKEKCIARKIKAIKDEKPETKQEQAIAMAESMCSKSCKEKKEEKAEEVETKKNIDKQVKEAKEKVSKPALIKAEDICSKEEFEKVQSLELKKCLQYVGELAFHLSQLHQMEERFEAEEKIEGEDPKSEPEYNMLVENLKGLGETLKALANKAVEEMVEEEEEESPEEEAEIMMMSDEKKDIEKVGKEISAKNVKTITGALKQLQEAINVLSSLNLGSALTPEEEKKLKEGLKAGSTITSGDHVEEKPVTPPAKVVEMKADNELQVAIVETEAELQKAELAKVRSELSTLKEQFAKLQNTPLPIKAKASYVVVDKFDDSKHVELEKAEGRMNELSKLLSQPHDPQLEQEANQLSLRILRLRREARNNK